MTCFGCLFVFALALYREQVAAKDPWPTYHKDVAPILHTHCATCHRENEVAPFPLLTYGDARKRADLINEVVVQHTMPPWKPDEGHGEFLEERRLTEAQITTLSRWAEAGAPEGNIADASPAPRFKTGWQLGKPDIILKMPEAFQVSG